MGGTAREKRGVDASGGDASSEEGAGKVETVATLMTAGVSYARSVAGIFGSDGGSCD